MEKNINWLIVIPVIVVCAALIVYLIFRNRNDEKQFERSENAVVEDDEKNDSY